MSGRKKMHNDTVKHIKERPHSYEFGKAGNRFKLYFNSVMDLQDMISALEQWNFPVDNAYINEKEVQVDGKQNNT